MMKLKVKIDIPSLNKTGELKDVKSIEIVEQLERILIENKLDYTITYSVYKEGDKDGQK